MKTMGQTNKNGKRTNEGRSKQKNEQRNGQKNE